MTMTTTTTTDRLVWNLWIYERGWRVLASYETHAEAAEAVARAGDAPADYRIVVIGSPADRKIRRNCAWRHP